MKATMTAGLLLLSAGPRHLPTQHRLRPPAVPRRARPRKLRHWPPVRSCGHRRHHRLTGSPAHSAAAGRASPPPWTTPLARSARPSASPSWARSTAATTALTCPIPSANSPAKSPKPPKPPATPPRRPPRRRSTRPRGGAALADGVKFRLQLRPVHLAHRRQRQCQCQRPCRRDRVPFPRVVDTTTLGLTPRGVAGAAETGSFGRLCRKVGAETCASRLFPFRVGRSRRPEGRAAASGTAGAVGTVASTEGPAPRTGSTETTRSSAPPGTGPKGSRHVRRVLGPRRTKT
ncbi:hypothetical protein RKD18_007714 [Streptomyces phaeoluteigriseus]